MYKTIYKNSMTRRDSGQGFFDMMHYNTYLQYKTRRMKRYKSY